MERVLLVLSLLLTGCPESTGVTDGGLPLADAAAPTDAAASDAGMADAGSTADVGGAADAGGVPDAGALVAVVGARCRVFERLAVITVGDEGGPSRSLSASFQDKPDPWVGQPELSDSSCRFHQAWSGTCDGKPECASGLACSHTGTCVAFPAPVPGLAVTVHGASTSQRLEAKPDGSLWGDVTVKDPALRLTVTAGSLRVEVPPMAVPAALVDAKADLKGSYEDPQAMDLTWTAPADAAHVHSLTNINHHVGGPTFTECVVEATKGALHIDGAMLEPLAVVTGLEFQAIQHVRFAAVDVPGGCVEIRFQRTQMVW